MHNKYYPSFSLKKISQLVAVGCLSISLSAINLARADSYIIDTKFSHASINFAISHYGFSMLTGRFDTFSGEFNYDETKPETNSVNVSIETKSVDSNHAERDGHLRGEKFLNVAEFDKATFVSTKVIPGADKTQFDIVGDLTLKGVTKSITIHAKKLGEGTDPWGGHRVGFEGTTELALVDYKIKVMSPASAVVKLTLYIEGVKK